MSKKGGRRPDSPGEGAVGGPPAPGSEETAPASSGAKVIPFQRRGARCPTCGKTPAGREFQPFCSKRCADIDLGRWLKEGYRIPGPPALDEGVAARGEGIAAGREGDGPGTRDHGTRDHGTRDRDTGDRDIGDNDGTPYDDSDLL